MRLALLPCEAVAGPLRQCEFLEIILNRGMTHSRYVTLQLDALQLQAQAGTPNRLAT